MRSYRVNTTPDSCHLSVDLFHGDRLTHTLYIVRNPFNGSYRVCKDRNSNVLSEHNELVDAYNAMLDAAKAY